jgi:hypothetical protein
MITGAGSMKSGGRFNAAGRFPAVYGSTTPELAMIESLAYQRRAGLPVQRAMPLVFKAISVRVERQLNLTESGRPRTRGRITHAGGRPGGACPPRSGAHRRLGTHVGSRLQPDRVPGTDPPAQPAQGDSPA